MIRSDTMQAYATGMIRPLARVFDCTTFWGASSAAAGFAAKRHLLRQSTAPTPTRRRRHARNWLRDNLPESAYKGIDRHQACRLRPPPRPV